MVLDRLDGRLRAKHSGRVLFREVNRRRDQVRRMRMRQLHHSLAQVRLDDLHAKRFEVGVQLDLFTRHRLDLGHHHAPAIAIQVARAPRVPADLGDDVARRGGVFGEVNLAADGLEALLELLDELGQSLEVGPPPRFQIGASLGEVEAFESLVAPIAQPGHGVGQRVLKVRVVKRLVDPARKVTPGFRHGWSRLLSTLGLLPAGSTQAPSILSRRRRRRADRRLDRSRRTGGRGWRRAQAQRCLSSP